MTFKELCNEYEKMDKLSYVEHILDNTVDIFKIMPTKDSLRIATYYNDNEELIFRKGLYTVKDIRDILYYIDKYKKERE